MKKFLVILTLLLLFLINSTQAETLIIDPYINITPDVLEECKEASVDGTCEVANLIKSDPARDILIITKSEEGKYGRINLSSTWSEYWNKLQDINPQTISACLQGGTSDSIDYCSFGNKLGDDNGDECYFYASYTIGVVPYRKKFYREVFNKSTHTCQYWNDMERTVCGDVTSFFDHVSKLKTFELSWYGFDADDTNTSLCINWIYINITYFPLTFDFWNFTNYSTGEVLTNLNIKRGTKINVSSHWSIKDVNYTFLTHNATGTFLNYTGPKIIANDSLNEYWINFTLDTSDLQIFNKVGPIEVKRIFANNSFGTFNYTSPPLIFNLYGYSQVSEIMINDSVIYNGTSISITCRVIDANLSNPLSNYPVNFYIDETHIGGSFTNSSGYASIVYNDSTLEVPKTYTIKCNITDKISSYYYACEKNFNTTILKVTDLNVFAAPSVSFINYGSFINFTINITNASSIEFIKINITYTNISNSQLENVSETYDLNLENCNFYSSYPFSTCSFVYFPKNSGPYYLNISVDANAPRGIVYNLTDFDVSFGKVKSEILLPKENLLINQTFYSKIKVFSLDGDVWLVNMSFNSSNYSRIQINDGIFYPELVNIRNGSFIILNWNISSLDFGLTNLTFKAVPKNGTFNQTILLTDVIGFKGVKSATFLNFSQSITFFANVTGNVSELNPFVLLKFTNISDENNDGEEELVDSEIRIPMHLTGSSNDYYWFETTVVPPRSGEYESYIFSNSSTGSAINDSGKINVSFGKAIIKFVVPFYHILINQTFYIKVEIEAQEGDLWLTDVNLTILNQNPINISGSEKWLHDSNWNITNGSKKIEKWLALSKNLGLTRMKVEAVPAYGTYESFSEPFEIIGLKSLLLENSTYEGEFVESYVDEFILFKSRIVGNVSASNVNFTLVKPYNSGIESFFATSTLIKNITECGFEVEVGNVASLEKGGSAYASVNPNDSNYTIDEDEDTLWSSITQATLNITLKNIYPVGEIEILWSTDLQDRNASLFYRDEDGSWKILESNIPIPTEKNLTIFKGFVPFKADMFSLNSSSGFRVYEFRVFPVEPRLGKCYVFTYNFTNFTRSGNYSVFSDVLTNFSDAIHFNSSRFFVRFGTPLLQIDSGVTPPATVTGKNETYKIWVKAFRGDLRNVSFKFTSINESILNITQDESFVKYEDEILYGFNNSFEWKIKAITLPSGYENYTVLTFINASSLTNLGNNNSVEYEITVYSEDLIPPDINNFWFEYKEKETDITNLHTNFEIIANVTDNVWIRYVNMSIIYPNGTPFNLTATKISADLYKFTFDSKAPLDKVGNYSVKIYAVDVGDNLNSSGYLVEEFKYFEVVDSYSLKMSPLFTVYNRGESITLSAYDVNGNLVETPYWDVNLTKIDQIENYNLTNTTFNYKFNETDPTGNYSIHALAIKEGNSGELTYEFNLTNILIIEILVPVEGSTYEKNAQIEAPGIRIWNFRKDKEIVSNVSVNALCLDEYGGTSLFNLSYDVCEYRPDLFSFVYCKRYCYSPNADGKTFNITFNASDNYNNFGIDYVLLKTVSPGTISTPPPAPSAGGGVPMPCSCTPWSDVGCGIVCEEYEMYQERVCTPVGCSNETRCILSEKCIPTIDFDLKLNKNEVSIESGYDLRLIASFKNRGSRITLNLRYETDCENCRIILPDKITLQEKEEKSIDIRIHIPLDSKPSEYILKIISSGLNVSKSVSILLRVKENEFISKLRTLEKSLSRLYSIVLDLENSGVDVQKLERLFSRSNSLIENGRKSVEEDNFILLKENVLELQEIESKVNAEVSRLSLIRWLSENKWSIIILSTFSFFSVYWFTQIMIPYYRLKKEIGRLIDEEKALVKSRIEAEKQYFTRKIDEKTFFNIMTEKQGEILKVRAKIKQKKEEKSKLIIRRLHPKEIGRWVKRLLTKGIRIVSSPLRRLKLKKVLRKS